MKRDTLVGDHGPSSLRRSYKNYLHLARGATLTSECRKSNSKVYICQRGILSMKPNTLQEEREP